MTVGDSHLHHLLLDLPDAVLSVGDLWCGDSLRSRCFHVVGFSVPLVVIVSSSRRSTLARFRSAISQPRHAVSGSPTHRGGGLPPLCCYVKIDRVYLKKKKISRLWLKDGGGW